MKDKGRDISRPLRRMPLQAEQIIAGQAERPVGRWAARAGRRGFVILTLAIAPAAAISLAERAAGAGGGPLWPHCSTSIVKSSDVTAPSLLASRRLKRSAAPPNSFSVTLPSLSVSNFVMKRSLRSLATCSEKAFVASSRETEPLLSASAAIILAAEFVELGLGDGAVPVGVEGIEHCLGGGGGPAHLVPRGGLDVVLALGGAGNGFELVTTANAVATALHHLLPRGGHLDGVDGAVAIGVGGLESVLRPTPLVLGDDAVAVGVHTAGAVAASTTAAPVTLTALRAFRRLGQTRGREGEDPAKHHKHCHEFTHSGTPPEPVVDGCLYELLNTGEAGMYHEREENSAGASDSALPQWGQTWRLARLRRISSMNPAASIPAGSPKSPTPRTAARPPRTLPAAVTG